jgi:DNA polymerase-3 subunit epsilon/oligoribonuclease
MLGVFLDTETNGLDPAVHCLIELAFKVVAMEDGKILEELQQTVSISPEQWGLSDPNSLKVNEFSFKEIAQSPSSASLSSRVIKIFQNLHIERGRAVFICQNPSFDRGFFYQIIPLNQQESLQWPYHWLDLASMHWALAIARKKKEPSFPFPWDIGCSKDAIAKYYGLPEEAKPHRAMNGVEHLIACYKKLIGFIHK